MFKMKPSITDQNFNGAVQTCSVTWRVGHDGVNFLKAFDSELLKMMLKGFKIRSAETFQKREMDESSSLVPF